ncbi:MAG TPA: HNH endonuclease [Pseudonocardiaceae bacterium]|nr:HNH endonuclease [Pseudonocardiaceae bacterium]
MPIRAQRPCLDCGRLSHGSRCPRCAQLVERKRTTGKRQRRPYTAAERTRRAAAVAEHRALYGDRCPGWRRPEHYATDLTADHVIPVAAGGAEDGQLSVLCRSCNGAKQHRLR